MRRGTVRSRREGNTVLVQVQGRGIGATIRVSPVKDWLLVDADYTGRRYDEQSGQRANTVSEAVNMVRALVRDVWDTAERPVWEVDGIVWAESAPRAWKWWRLEELHAFQVWARAHNLDARVPLFVQQWMSRKFSDYRAGGQLRVLLEDGRLVPPLPVEDDAREVAA
jgi:hypothetical protein